jgi:hypothetical protein
MRAAGDVCRRVLTRVEGSLRPSLVDFETGLELGVIEAVTRAEPRTEGGRFEATGALESAPPKRSPE